MTQQPPGYGPSGQRPQVHWGPPPQQGYYPPQLQPLQPAPAPTLRAKPSGPGAFMFIAGLLVLLWAIEAADFVTAGALDSFGIRPRSVESLPAILVAPLLHFGFSHLAANSLPFLVLGTITRMSGRRDFWIATGFAVLGSGLTAWLLAAPNSVTAGASGLIFGWLTYLLVRGLIAGNWMQILIAAIVFGFFGGMLWGVFPTVPGVSWQAHLGGAAGGVLAAWMLGRSSRPRASTAR